MSMEVWNEICFILSENITKEISEDEFEKYMIQALRILGWKQYTDDFDVRPSFQIGSANRITPDFVIKSQTNQKLFVIEIKQPHLPITNNFQKQLFSYMRQLKLSYGLLIGQSIQIFYDGAAIQQDDPILIDTIKFERNSKKGEKFIQLFSKKNFNEQSLETYAKEFIDKINRIEKVEKLASKIISENFKNTLLGLIKQELINEYDRELIESALEKVQVSITKKTGAYSTPHSQKIDEKKILDSSSKESPSKETIIQEKHTHGNHQKKNKLFLPDHIQKSHEMDVDDFLKILADKYIDDQKEREIFLGNKINLNSKMNYITALSLTKEGKEIFSQKDIINKLKEIISSLSEVSNQRISGVLVIADHRIGIEDPKFHKGYPFLENIERGKYRFKGFL